MLVDVVSPGTVTIACTNHMNISHQPNIVTKEPSLTMGSSPTHAPTQQLPNHVSGPPSS